MTSATNSTDVPPVGPATVTSNGVAIPFGSEYFAPMRDSGDLLPDAAALARRFRVDGYLLIRGLLAPEAVMRQRAAYFSMVDPRYLRPGTKPVEGIYSGAPIDTGPQYGVRGHAAYDFVRSSGYADFCADTALRTVAEALLAGPAVVLPRRIVRHFHRGSGMASRAHVDHDYMSQGSDRCVTAWIPLGNCPLAIGGLIYLENSVDLTTHELARLRSVTDRTGDSRPISHDLLWMARQTGRRWLWTDYAAGDVAFHSPRIVHASLDNATEEMRLSTDLRFMREGEPVDARWTKAWSADDGA